ncbi:MAG: tRNA (guanosine(37)-N1)-methyltransferase TrmD [Firmicutes bacterium]|nr:tRNA (guanosine(37)-N1)-methyltransferase TrmD [Bacillota bacterium]
MKIDILTLFPDCFAPLKTSIINRAVEKGILEINLVNFRDFSQDKHKKVDDIIYGGGAGLLLTPQPIIDAIDSLDVNHKALRVYTSPKGKKFNSSMAKQLAKYDHIIILCGHYEGVDQRVIDSAIDMEISIGDYILTGGELPAMVIVDALARHIDGVINAESLKDESFEQGLLEYPQYTRPRDFNGMQVPEVLVNGNHAQIAKWKRENSKKI